jgi:hypothetical protein
VKKTAVVIVVLVAVVMGFVAGIIVRDASSHRPTVVTSFGPTVTELQKLAELVTTKVYVADVLIGESAKYRGSWLIKGDALIAVDMNKAAIVSRDDAMRTAVVRLPAPRVVQPRVDHEKTRTWDVERKTWKPWVPGSPDDLRDEAMRQAQQLVADAAGNEEALEYARRRAEALIPQFYEMVGWKVQVVWEGPAPAG